jgi:outer membrane lipoprotein-sorting protein
MKRVAWLLAVAAGVAGTGAGQDARQIVAESQKRGEAKSERYEGRLQVFESGKTITEKRWQYERLGSYGNSQSVLRFTAPPEVKGVALLVINHPDRASDQWMWTPAIGRERRIALQDRSTRFFGTDFSFEDLEERDVDQFDFQLRGEEAVDGVPCWRIESRPRRTKSSQYTQSVIWVRQTDYVPARLDAYIKDQVVRRLHYSRIEKIQGIWTARTLEMADLRRKSRTVLDLDELQFNVPMKAEDFTVPGLKRE